MKVILVVLDSAGVGALPDAKEYDDTGANTLGNIAKTTKNFDLPNLFSLGLGKLLPAPYPPAGGLPPAVINGSYGKMSEMSKGKDTTIGHWELAGLITEQPLPTYPDGFPENIIKQFEDKIGTKILANYASSGTEIIKKFGEEHCRTGHPIVYTSADSVFQVAAHEDEKIFGLKRLYKICKIAREILVSPNNVGRVIARPFIGRSGDFKRTSNRHDYSLDPPESTLLDKLIEYGIKVVGIGKIKDIFNSNGITLAIPTLSNKDGMEKTLKTVLEFSSSQVLKSTQEHKNTRTQEHCLIFTNLVDFDMLWGHRRNVQAYYRGLKEFDDFLPKFYEAMDKDDILFITADHGCDPTHIKHTDHTREYVPVLVFGKKLKKGADLGIRKTFADLGQTIAELFGINKLKNGKSFLRELF
ncbi:MAG: phosphopentomutase [Elusimicrobia bacterium]|nr:phosphopentomutase [Elusimicrobiota bacterium]